MNRTCSISGESFEITDADCKFYEQYQLPLPTLCPEERLRRRITRRNFSNLYLRTCDFSGARILSRYKEGVSHPVYSTSTWWGDSWDALSFAREIDFSQRFFPQFQELRRIVPHPSVSVANTENCDYSNHAFYSKDCYMIFGCVRDEHCLFGHIVWNSEHCVDNLYIYECQWCSYCVDCVGCYDVHYSTETVNCQESYFLHDCRNCSNCFGCYNLRNSSYCLFNKQYTKSEYFEQLEQVLPRSWQDVIEINNWLEQKKREDAIFPPYFATNVEECTGNHLYYSGKLKHCFDVKRGEESKYCYTNFDIFGSYDLSFGAGRFSYESLALVDCERNFFCNIMVNCSDAAYCDHCYSCRDIFGCVGLRNTKYAIFNRQYDKETYHALREKLIAHMRKTGEWGEMFPSSDSPFAYNESCAGEYLPLNKKEVMARGLRWDEKIGELLSGVEQPEGVSSVYPPISEVSDDILEKQFSCTVSNAPYKITRAELAFYRRMNLPLPTYQPKVRSALRMAKRARRILVSRTCAKCSRAITAAYSESEAGKVYCQECYLAELKSPA